MARSSDDYRAAKRNALREKGLLRTWRFLGVAAKANQEAKLQKREKVCAQARSAVLHALASGKLAGLGNRAVLVVLTDFWSKQPDSRVRSRILRELRPA